MRLLEGLATTEPLAAVFSDAAILDAMIRFEAGLARALASAGLIPAGVADVIAAVPAHAFDAAAIADASRKSGTIAVPFVTALVAQVKTADPEASAFVHRGATSQDVTDTALVLCLQEADRILSRDHRRLAAALTRLSDRHSGSVMLARTLLQPAEATTFGLKAAGWLGGAGRAAFALREAFAAARALQLGGPAGTLAALGDAGPAVAEHLAAQLGLAWPGAPWHTDRGRFASVATCCAIYTAALAKMARDVSLLMQFEVGEAAEPGGPSSSMPHKRNPSGCAVILAAATRVPALTAAVLAGAVHEHERGLGGWHAEALTLAEIVQATGSALAAAADVAESLTVDADRMRRNLEATRGVVFTGTDPGLGAAEIFRRRLLDEFRG